MAKLPRPRKKSYPELPATLQEAIEAMHEVFGMAPGSAEMVNDIAKERGVSFEHQMHEFLAFGYSERGQPMPPELRKYILHNQDKINPKWRDQILKPLMS